MLVPHVGSCHYGQGTRSLKATSQMDAHPQIIGTGDFRSFAIFTAWTRSMDAYLQINGTVWTRSTDAHLRVIGTGDTRSRTTSDHQQRDRSGCNRPVLVPHVGSCHHGPGTRGFR